MSQGKFLPEDEVKTLISELLNIKLDRNSLQNPDSNIVCEIYTRFLDLTLKDKWRKSPEDGFEPSLKILMKDWLRFLFEPYNVGYDFNFYDLVKPKRNRTTAFLNIIIHIRITIEESREDLKKREAQYLENQAAWERLNEEIEQVKLLRDELALKKASLKSSCELQELKGHLQAVFEEKKKFIDELEQRGAIAKRELEEAKEKHLLRRSKIEALERELAQKSDLLRKLEEGLLLEPRRAESEQKLKDLQTKTYSVEGDIQKSRNRLEDVTESVSTLDRISIDVASYKNLFATYNREREAHEEKIRKIEADRIETQAKLTKEQANLRLLESTRDELKLKYDIQLETVRRELSDKRSKRSEKEVEFNKELEQIEEQIADVKKQQIKYRTDLKNKQDEYEAQLEKAQRLFDAQVKKFQESKQKEQRAIERLVEHSNRQETIIGKAKENDMPANRTYIKESK